MNFLEKVILFMQISQILINTVKGNSSEAISFTNKPSEPENKAELFYQTLNDSLRASPEYKTSKRVDCIIKYMKSENAFEVVDKNLFDFVLNNNSEFKAVFVNQSAVMIRLESKLDKANFDCTIGGIIAIILISTILIVVVSCVACISRK
jgi:hypothetical protein